MEKEQLNQNIEFFYNVNKFIITKINHSISTPFYFSHYSMSSFYFNPTNRSTSYPFLNKITQGIPLTS